MHQLKLFAVKDEKTQLFTHPNFVVDEIAATRGVSIVSNDPNSNLCHFPADYTLWCLGSLDVQTGVFTSKIDFIQTVTVLKSLLPKSQSKS